MTFTISKDYQFSASHQLAGLPDGHPCGRLHGHNYVVRLELSGSQVDRAGMLFDYGRLKPFQEYIDSTMDHRHLNDHERLTNRNPTAEVLAEVLAGQANMLLRALLPAGVTIAVGVSETPKTWAWYR